MNSLSAWIMGQLSKGNELMVFDWDKAAGIIKRTNPKVACAGLSGDWEWTGGTIYEDGEIVRDSYTHLSSTWAVPELDIDGMKVECYRMQCEVPGWDYDTKWPESAVKILQGEAKEEDE